MHIVDLSRSLCCSNYFEHLTKILHPFPASYLTPYDVIQTILDQQWTRDERKTNQDPNSKTIEQRLLILWPWKKKQEIKNAFEDCFCKNLQEIHLVSLNVMAIPSFRFWRQFWLLMSVSLAAVVHNLYQGLLYRRTEHSILPMPTGEGF